MNDGHEVTFEWPFSEPNHVVVTGTFDQWSSSVKLSRDGNLFKASTVIPWEEKIQYKFIVDGNWLTSPHAPTEADPSGNMNNVYTAPSKPAPPPPAPVEPEVKPEPEPVVAVVNGDAQAAPEAEPVPVPEGKPEETLAADPVIEPVAVKAPESTEPVAPAPVEPPAATLVPVPEPVTAPAVPETAAAPTTNGHVTNGHVTAEPETVTPRASMTSTVPTSPAKSKHQSFPSSGSLSPSRTSTVGSRKKRMSIFGSINLKSMFSSDKKKEKKEAKK